MAELTKVYTSQEVANLLKVGIRLVQRLIGDGKLKALKVGRCWRITQPALEAYLAGGPRAKGPDDTLEMIELVD